MTAFLACFVFGGFTGLLLANAAIDLAYHDTYFVIGHFHYVLSIAAAIGLVVFFGTAYSVLSGFVLVHVLASSVIVAGIAGINGLFLVQHLVGIEGHPRRVFMSPESCVVFASFANAGLFVTAVVLVCFPSVVSKASASDLVTVAASASRSSVVVAMQSDSIVGVSCSLARSAVSLDRIASHG